MADLRPTGGSFTDKDFIAPVNWIPEIYSKKVLQKFYKQSIYQDICNTDYSGEIAGQGAKVHIRKTPTMTANDYTIGGGITYEVQVENSLVLEIDKGVYTAFQVNDVLEAQTDLNTIDMYSADAAKQVNLKIDKEVLSYMPLQAAATNQGATAGAESASVDLGAITGVGASIVITKDNAITKIVEMNQVLDEAQIPDGNRWMTLPPWYCAMLKLGDLKRVDVTGDATGVIRNGLIGEVDGTKIYKSSQLLTATDGDTKTSWYIMMGTNEASTFAAQLDKAESLTNPDDFGQYWRTLMIYGRKVVQPTALATMVARNIA